VSLCREVVSVEVELELGELVEDKAPEEDVVSLEVELLGDELL
jgi:hypothetical protein